MAAGAKVIMKNEGKGENCINNRIFPGFKLQHCCVRWGKNLFQRWGGEGGKSKCTMYLYRVSQKKGDDRFLMIKWLNIGQF